MDIRIRRTILTTLALNNAILDNIALHDPFMTLSILSGYGEVVRRNIDHEQRPLSHVVIVNHKARFWTIPASGPYPLSTAPNMLHLPLYVKHITMARVDTISSAYIVKVA